jgi:cob(I)alamin adenosyltransferase
LLGLKLRGLRQREREIMDDCGYVHVYTGDGKGKTTAALGLAMRAVGAGWNVFMAQFVKGMKYSELAAMDLLSPQLQVRQYGRSCFLEREPQGTDFERAEHGLGECRRAAASGDYQMVILDEANVAVAFGLLRVDDLIQCIDDKPPGMELVFTGRWAHPQLLERADLVTEMKEVKHYYQRGILARVGVEK